MSPFETIRSRKARQTAVLPDGRRLGYADTGDESLPPVFYFHGFPGSRLEASFLTIPGARLIGANRLILRAAVLGLGALCLLAPVAGRRGLAQRLVGPCARRAGGRTDCDARPGQRSADSGGPTRAP